MAYNNQIMNQALQGGGNLTQLPLYGNQQQGGIENLLSQLRGMGLEGLKNPTQGFGAYEQAARRGFENQTIPLLAERFASIGGTDSSGYKNALTGAGTGFELGLNQQREQFGQNNVGNLLQMLQLGLKPSTENIYSPPGRGFGSAIAGGLGTGAGLAGTLGLSGALGNTGLLSGLGSSLSGLGTSAGLGALASNPATLPILLALLAGGGLYAYSQSGD